MPAEASEEIIYELFLQAGPIESVSLKTGFGFVTFEDEESVLYACSLFENVKLFDRELKVKPRSGSKYLESHIASVPPFPRSVPLTHFNSSDSSQIRSPFSSQLPDLRCVIQSSHPQSYNRNVFFNSSPNYRTNFPMQANFDSGYSPCQPADPNNFYPPGTNRRSTNKSARESERIVSYSPNTYKSSNRHDFHSHGNNYY